MAGNDFNLDRQEYQSVFKVFDKDNSGEITISQVYELINKFDDAQKLADAVPGTADVSMLNPGSIQNTHGLNGKAGGGGPGAKGAILQGKSPTTKKPSQAMTSTGVGLGAGLQLKPTAVEGINGKSPRMIGDKNGSSMTVQQQQIKEQMQQQQQKDSQWSQPTQMLSEEINFGNVPLSAQQQEDRKQEQQQPTFPNGKSSLKFDEFFNIVKDSCQDREAAENYLVYAFSMFDRKKKGFINTEDLKEVFSLLGESVTDDEVNTMIKIAGVKSNDKINFKEFVDFFNKVD